MYNKINKIQQQWEFKLKSPSTYIMTRNDVSINPTSFFFPFLYFFLQFLFSPHKYILFALIDKDNEKAFFYLIICVGNFVSKVFLYNKYW